MKNDINASFSIHLKTGMLLPWYVNGTLDSYESLLVKNHLAHCEKCREELEFLQHLSTAVIQQEVNQELQTEQSYSRLLKKIEFGKDSGRYSRFLRFKSDCLGFLSDRIANMTLPPTGYASIAGIIILFVFFTTGYYLNEVKLNDPLSSPHVYRTLSDASQTHLNNTVKIIFSDQTSRVSVDKLIKKINGQIISGPDVRGVYTVSVKSDSIYDLIKDLKKNQQIVFVEPALL